MVTTAVTICSINKRRQGLHLRIIHHQLLFTSADILSLTSEHWAAGKATVLIGMEGRHDWGLMKALLFFPQILFFHVLVNTVNSFFFTWSFSHVFAHINTFPIDILWTEFVNKNTSYDTHKFRLYTLGVSVEFHSALCQLCWQCLRPLGCVASVGEEGGDVWEVMYTWSHTLVIWVHLGNVLPRWTFLSPKKKITQITVLWFSAFNNRLCFYWPSLRFVPRFQKS